MDIGLIEGAETDVGSIPVFVVFLLLSLVLALRSLDRTPRLLPFHPLDARTRQVNPRPTLRSERDN